MSRLALALATIIVLPLLVACPQSPNPDGEGEAGGEGEGEGEGEGVDPFVLFARMNGLWAGPADSQTSLGDFVLMSMDHRPTGGVLFARGDLDSNNAMRWWWWRDAEDRLRFDNGGYFAGLFRSDSCVLESATNDVFRFCHVDQGCDHIDARFTFTGPDALTMQVTVNGAPHVTWTADRMETRDPLPASFPPDLTQIGPNLPSLAVAASWAAPASDGASAWLVLTTTACGLTGATCDVSRSFRQPLVAQSTSQNFVVQEIHPGGYFAFLVIDNNGNFASVPFPDGGDFVSIPDQALTVDEVEGGTLTISAPITR